MTGSIANINEPSTFQENVLLFDINETIYSTNEELQDEMRYRVNTHIDFVTGLGYWVPLVTITEEQDAQYDGQNIYSYYSYENNHSIYSAEEHLNFSGGSGDSNTTNGTILPYARHESVFTYDSSADEVHYFINPQSQNVLPTSDFNELQHLLNNNTDYLYLGAAGKFDADRWYNPQADRHAIVAVGDTSLASQGFVFETTI